MTRAAQPPAPQSPHRTLVLAALARAECHHMRALPGVPSAALLAHLGIRTRSAASRATARRLAELRRAGHVSLLRRRGVAVWQLTAAGSSALERERRLGRAPELPESPQHRAWREARACAAQVLPCMRDRLSAGVARTQRVLASPAASSDEWFALAQELERCCRLLGSASHCLREWPEPDDARADRDRLDAPGDGELDPRELARRRSLRRGRRNTALWREPL